MDVRSIDADLMCECALLVAAWKHYIAELAAVERRPAVGSALVAGACLALIEDARASLSRLLPRVAEAIGASPVPDDIDGLMLMWRDVWSEVEHGGGGETSGDGGGDEPACGGSADARGRREDGATAA